MTWIGSRPHSANDAPPPTDKARILIFVINCLRELGEPSTVGELAAYARPRVASQVAQRLEQDIAAILAQYSLPPSDPAETAPFQRVERRGVEAWAFSPVFRQALSDSGLPILARAPEES